MLQINNTNGVFEVKGSLVAENSGNLRNYFELLLQHKENIVLSLDKIESMDASGIHTIISLYKKAIQTNKVFSIIGKSNKKISKALNISKLKYIVKNDFL